MSGKHDWSARAVAIPMGENALVTNTLTIGRCDILDRRLADGEMISPVLVLLAIYIYIVTGLVTNMSM